ncbi:esterase/lipase family protein [Nocardia terrae]|nr:alpha/beta fold hydrolase [Nocardia terrae]
MQGPPQRDVLSAVRYALENPKAIPSGMNDFSCKPAAAHPYPVVLVNGTFGNMYMNWSMYSPQLAADGYCVFGLDYGSGSGPISSPFWHQVGSMRSSARELGDFIEVVRGATGAAKVDLVGYSQGGLVPLYYINQLGGADEVDTMIGVAPPSNGIAVYGILPWIASNQGVSAAFDSAIPAVQDVTAGSDFVRETASGGLARPNVRYVTIVSRTDSVVQLGDAHLPDGPNVTNMAIQDQCADYYGDHTTYIYNEIALRLVRNSLDLANAVPLQCRLVLPLVN